MPSDPPGNRPCPSSSTSRSATSPPCILDIPFGYIATVVPYRKRKHIPVVVCDRLPMRLPEYGLDEAPVAVVAHRTTGDEQQMLHRAEQLDGLRFQRHLPPPGEEAPMPLVYHASPLGGLLVPLDLNQGRQDGPLRLLRDTAARQLDEVAVLEGARCSPMLRMGSLPLGWRPPRRVNMEGARRIRDDRASRIADVRAALRGAAFVDGTFCMPSRGPGWLANPWCHSIYVKDEYGAGFNDFRADRLGQALAGMQKEEEDGQAGDPDRMTAVMGSIEVLLPQVFADDREERLAWTAEALVTDPYIELREWSRAAILAWVDLRDALARTRVGLDADLGEAMAILVRTLGAGFDELANGPAIVRILRQMGCLAAPGAEDLCQPQLAA